MILNFDVLSLPSIHFSERDGAKIDLLVLHSVGLPLINVFKNFNDYGVSAHYLIPQINAVNLQKLMPKEFGSFNLTFPECVPVIQLVNVDKKAWHAGISSFSNFNEEVNCLKGVNANSIGIEFHAEGYANGDGSDWYKFMPFTKGQQETGIELINFLIDKYAIPHQNLLAHSSISVGRKTDPGPLFFWKELNDAGIGCISKPSNDNFKSRSIINDEEISFIQNKLYDIGFIGCPQTGKLDESTQRYIDAYVMQFASHLWESQDVEINNELITSIDNFNCTINSSLVFDNTEQNSLHCDL